LGLFDTDSIPPSLEGYLFPETYFFDRSLTEAEMIQTMVKQFLLNWNPHKQLRLHTLQISRHHLIILASMIEKEAGCSLERPIISSVFHNRIKKKMRLQSCATAAYGIWHRFQGKIHKTDLWEKNKYNTYRIKNLPIGPIANPGNAAIHAALYPTKTNYLYFVSHNNGTHTFSETLVAHNRAVKKYQLNAQ